MQLKQFVKDLAAKLQAAGIDYCITGGYAVSGKNMDLAYLKREAAARDLTKDLSAFVK